MIVKIGRLSIDTASPCDVVEALSGVRMQLVTGGAPKAVWFGDDKVEYASANLSKLEQVIAEWQGKCDVANGAAPRRRRYAARFRN